MASLMNEDEKKLVGDAYQKIAHHFDVTRISIWQGVQDFLSELPVNSLVGDIGCGNGKNMSYRKDELKYLGCDTCPQFIKMGKDKGLSVKEGNVLDIPFADNTFDATICIAVIHHLTTAERRIKAISELARITKPGGKIMIQVWATKQPEKSRRTFTPGINIVPWVNNITFEKTERYYYVFEDGELEKLCESIPTVSVEKSFYEFGNWGIILQLPNSHDHNLDPKISLDI